MYYILDQNLWGRDITRFVLERVFCFPKRKTQNTGAAPQNARFKNQIEAETKQNDPMRQAPKRNGQRNGKRALESSGSSACKNGASERAGWRAGGRWTVGWAADGRAASVR